MMVSIVFFFGSLLGDIASSMTNSDVKRASYKHKLNAVINQLVCSLLMQCAITIYSKFGNIFHYICTFQWTFDPCPGTCSIYDNILLLLFLNLLWYAIYSLVNKLYETKSRSSYSWYIKMSSQVYVARP